MTVTNNIDEFLNSLEMKNTQDDDVQEVLNPKVKKPQQKLKLDSVEKTSKTRANVPKGKLGLKFYEQTSFAKFITCVQLATIAIIFLFLRSVCVSHNVSSGIAIKILI